MNLEGKNYTLKCKSQKKATKCLVKEGDQGGVKVLATIQCLAIKKTILQAWSHIELVCLDENTFLGIAKICCCEIVKTIQYINYHCTSIQPCLATAWQYKSKYSRNITKLYTNYKLLFEENISIAHP